MAEQSVPITVYNTTDIDQFIWREEVDASGAKDFKRYVLPARQHFEFPEEIARDFLAQRAGACIEHAPLVIPNEGHEELVWIANMTGNPLLPDEVVIGIDSKNEPIKMRNPLKTPIPLVWETKSAEQIIHTGAGNSDEALRFPGSYLILPPYERHPVPISLARQRLTRDSMSQPGWIGKLAEVRGPTEFEPNRSWNVADMWIFANLVDPTVFAQKELHKLGITTDTSAAAEYTAKQWIWTRLFFRLCDRNYALPPREVFEKVKAAGKKSK